jgi:hypothetical protein
MALPPGAEGWRCPACGRRFIRRPIEHSCQVRTLDAHLARCEAHVKQTFDALESALARIGPHNTLPVKTMILLRATRNFGNVKVKRDALDLEFVSSRRLTSPRILKTDQYGARFTHHVRLESPDDVDREIVRWLKEAYAIGAR